MLRQPAERFENIDERNAEEVRYLDSLSNQEVFNIGIAQYTYNEVKDKASLGLDLKGSINVILEISVKDILKV